MPNNFQKYSIDDIVCTPVQVDKKSCDVRSEIKFEQKIQFIDLAAIQALNDTTLTDNAKNLLNQPYTMDVNQITNLLNKTNLQNLGFPVNSSGLLSKH